MTEEINVDELLPKMAASLQEHCQANGLHDPIMIGIHTGGAWVARELHALLGWTTELGELNIDFYRDDFAQIGMHAQASPSRIPFSVEDRDIVLVDDVLFTGRTTRAALNEIFDYGRPRSVTLVVLIDRGGRELPIQADIVGKHVTVRATEQVKLTGPKPLRLTVAAT